jgi:hypothetical protein
MKDEDSCAMRRVQKGCQNALKSPKTNQSPLIDYDSSSNVHIMRLTLSLSPLTTIKVSQRAPPFHVLDSQSFHARGAADCRVRVSVQDERDRVCGAVP